MLPNESSVLLTVIIDDYNGIKEGYIPAYGFSVLIEINNKRILFDTGTRPRLLLRNLRTYGITPADFDAIILSHNHYDHTDGLPGILEVNKLIPVYIHKDWNRRASFKGFKIPKQNQVVLDKGREITEISNNVFITDSYYSSDYGGVYEHALLIKSKKDEILISGCCHPGLNVFINYCQSNGLINNDLTIIGGFHGFKFSDTRAREIDNQLKSIILCHCTMHEKSFKNQFGKKCKSSVVGEKLRF